MTIDVFFEYAGLVKGFSISAASVSHFLNPIIMGFIVSDHVSFFFFFEFQIVAKFLILYSLTNDIIIKYFHSESDLLEFIFLIPKCVQCLELDNIFRIWIGEDARLGQVENR